MELDFKIKESISDLIADLKANDGIHWVIEPIETKKERLESFKIIDKEYSGSFAVFNCHDLRNYKKALLITAWSEFYYDFIEINGLCYCTYNGAYRGFLEQSLLPKITPKNLDSAIVTSSVVNPKNLGVIKLKEYIKWQSDNYDRLIKEKNFSGHRHPRIVADFLKTEK